MKKYIIILLIFLLNIDLINANISNKIIDSNITKTCMIINVDDGDTFDLKCFENGFIDYIYNVRTIGVNAPDIIINGKNNKKHCFYEESKNIIDLFKKNKRIFNVEFYGKDLCKDKYKGCRNLVRLKDKKTNIDINEFLIEEGYNFSWTSFSMIPLKLKSKYFIAEKRAKRNNKGLWKECNILYNYKNNYLNSGKPVKMTEL